MTSLYQCDATKIRVVAGDIQEGFWEIDGSIFRCVSGPHPAPTVELSRNIESIELKDMIKKDNLEPIVASAVGFMIGRAVFGMVGAAVGAVTCHFLSNTRPEVSVKCELKDGRKFIAVMSPPMYNRFSGLA